MSNQWSLKKKVAAGFGAMCVLMATGGVVTLLNVARLAGLFEHGAGVNASRLEMSRQAVLALADIHALERDEIAATRDAQAAEGWHDAAAGRIRKASEMVARMKALAPGEESRQGISTLADGLQALGSAEEGLWMSVRAGHPADAQKAYERALASSIQARKAAEDVEAAEQRAQSQSEEAGSATVARTRWIMLGLTVLFLPVCVLALWLQLSSIRDLKRLAHELHESQRQIASAAVQVASTSSSLAQGASQQAASLEQTSASVEEISSMTRKNAENSQSAAAVMTAVDQHVKDGNSAISQMVAAMREINSSSEEISKIIRVIDEIAFQTNILALNAAVEAARAGEAGMGFAVVADEVRSLAQRSAQAAKDTAALIENSIRKSEEGRTRLEQVTEVIRAITESSAKVKTLVDEVNLGSQEQARGIDEISKAVTQMNQVTQATAANAEESASASEELSAQAASMSHDLERLQAITGGGLPARAAADPVPAHEAAWTAPAAPRTERSAIPLDDNFTEF